MEEMTMEKTFDGIVDGKHVEVWTPTEEDKERAKQRLEELKNKKKKK
jgi:hypothetical protein